MERLPVNGKEIIKLMNIVVENMGACRKTLKIEMPAEKVKSTYDEVLDAYSKSAKLKGFRPGKAPRQLVERRFSKQISEDVKERLVPEGYQEAVKEKSLNVESVLEMGEVLLDPEKGMSFDVTVDVRPEFELPDYRGIPVKKEEPSVTDDEVDQAIERIRQQQASYEDVEDREIKRGDMALVDYEGMLDGRSIESLGDAVKGLGERRDFWVMVDENAFLPGFADGLAGMKPGDRKQIFVDFDKGFAVKELAGKQATYFVHVKGVREQVLPELNDEFAKQFNMDSLEKLREAVREDLKGMARDRIMSSQRSEIIKHLLSKVTMDVPESVVDRETKSIVDEIVRNNTARGVSRDEIVEKKDEIMETAGRNADERVRIQFILDAIAEKEKIDVSEDDLSGHINALAAQYGMDLSSFRAELEKRDALESTRNELRRNRTVEFLLEQADVKE